MEEDKRIALIDYRLKRSYETFREVECLMENGFYSGALNRLYYACYYAAVALLISEEIESQTHSGIKTMLSLHFVRTGKMDRNISKVFFKLFDLRHNNDYDDFTFCDEDTITKLLPQAQCFIRTVTDLIHC